jgi:hypothetical protein
VDTRGHHRVLLEGVEPRLRRAYAEKGDDDVNLQALFLGNWLLSQLNDPGSTAIAQIARDLGAGKAKSTVTRIVAQLTVALAAEPREDTPRGAAPPHLAALARRVRDMAEDLLSSCAVVARALEQESGGGGTSTLGTMLLSLTRVVGYLRFAVPESNPRGHSIRYSSYARIFDELCRQYFPHEHLDRPLCSSSYGTSCEAAWGLRHAGRRDRLYASAVGTGPDAHMYQYLVDDRTVLAGRLAELDLQWASKDFVAATMDPSERDVFLARLGHTMHGIEDFFAHSNFTEHAVQGLAAAAPVLA